MRTFIIAEAGVNHNGSVDLAKRLIDSAVRAGADAVKFQSFRSRQLVSAGAPKAHYQMFSTSPLESQLEMLQKLELSSEAHRELIAYSGRSGIEFMSTPFDLDSLAMLTRDFGLARIKISSGEVTNAPLLLAASRAADHIVLSTGMCTLADVERALGVIAFGFTQEGTPRPGAFELAYVSEEGQRKLSERVTLLHCTTEYPVPIEDVNLRAMDTLSTVFGLKVGYSDHTQGLHVPVAAVARGACLIEKHLTLDRRLPGPDQAASLEPEEMERMITAIRDIELALGNGIKQPAVSEQKNMVIARKSLVALRTTKAGEAWKIENLGCKRPGSGISPIEYWDWLGKHADRDYQEDELIESPERSSKQ